MTLIIKREKRLFLSKKKNRPLIIKNIIEKITKDKPLTLKKFNVDTCKREVARIRLDHVLLQGCSARINEAQEVI